MTEEIANKETRLVGYYGQPRVEQMIAQYVEGAAIKNWSVETQRKTAIRFIYDAAMATDFGFSRHDR